MCKITELSTLYAAHTCKHLSPSCAIQGDPESPRMAPQRQYIQGLLKCLKLTCSL